MKITFVDHSCYTVELEKHFIIYDYVRGKINLPDNKHILVVVTHGHADHYTEDIFKFEGDISYVISDDVDVSDYTNSRDIRIVSPDESINIRDYDIKTFGSTDEGISILINVEGKNIYHSGDLNYWIWPRYSEDDIVQMEKDFTAEVKKLGDTPIDVSMIIVDPRLKDDYDLAGSYFLKLLNAKYYFPMHMWGEYHLSKSFNEKYRNSYPKKNIMILEHENQVFNIE